MSAAPARWSDLAPRVMSGLAMAGTGAALVYLGGWAFAGAVCVLGGVMMWELAAMHGGKGAIGSGVLAAVALGLASFLSWFLVFPVLVAAVIVAAGQVDRDRTVFAGFAGLMLFACFAIIQIRWQAGGVWTLWLVLIVVVSDIAGYAAGRSLGGPKFWPRVSPKKTWSGTLAGWIGAAIVGGVFAAIGGAALPALVVISVLVAFAGQVGDIGESAIKRRAGVKDSSALIPGHGGVLDRFDAMLGAALPVMLLWWVGVLQGLS